MLDSIKLIKQNMLDYATQVNEERAIPDAKTGLKPIHRKILYEMFVDKINSKGKYHKNAKMVGQIIARFSEHGDAATYDALVRLSQPWVQRYLLIDFHGNYGSIFGDGPGAYRYTESKLSKLAEQGYLENLNKGLQDKYWGMNFTNEEKEPETLPALFPGLFCLPNQGIGYGAACNFLTFNLQDVYKLIEAYIKGEELPIIYYDLATGGTFINPSVMEKIYKEGKGSIVIESKYTIQGNKITFTEIPFGVKSDELLDKIIELKNNDELPHLVDIINDSGENNLKLVAEVDSAENVQAVLLLLFTKTALRSSFGINQIALVDNKPKRLTIKDMAQIYVEHNLDCIQKEHKSDLEKTNARINILKGLCTALEDIDNVVNLIKRSKNAESAKSNLMIKYDLNEAQAKAILDMKLQRLANLEKIEIQDELYEKQQLALQLKEILDSTEKQQEILLDRLRALVEKFNDQRRTIVEEKEVVKITKNKEDQPIIPEDIVITYSSLGYVQAIPLKLYKTRNDFVTSFKCLTTDMILLFSNRGRMFRISAGDLKQCGNKDKGTAIGALLQLEKNEKILNIFSSELNEKKPYITGVTKQGLVKKSQKAIFLDTDRRNVKGIKVATLKDKDEFLTFYETNGDQMILASDQGRVIRFDTSTITSVGKTAQGVKGIDLAIKDFIIGSYIVTDNLTSIKINDKIIKLSDIRVQQRGGKGRVL